MPVFRRYLFAGILLLCGAVYFTACATAPTQKPKKFVRKACLDCHTKFADKYLKMKTVHTVVRENKCEDCHLRHGIVPKLLLKKEGNQLCYDCHPKEKIGLNKPEVHTGLKKGKCITCHNPHASNARRLLKAEGREVCYQCHRKENFEKKVVHKIGTPEACLTCHLAHGSDEPMLLKDKEASLCISCHDNKKASFRQAHGGYPVEKSPCNSCHNPHGSTQPRLLKTSAHQPVAQKDCGKCHPRAGSDKPFETSQKGGKLCYECHKEADLKDGGRVEHTPFRKGECAACHAPHASENRRLLSKEGNRLCFACHAQRNVTLAVPHQAVTKERGCLSCHGSHAAQNQKLLTAKAPGLCFACHEKSKAELGLRHPHQPFKEGGCTACHDSHGSNYVGMLKNRMGSVCYSCHLETEIKFTKTNTHQPVIDGNCSSCHRSHGSNYANILLSVADDPKLCSGCHGDFMKPETGTGSNHEFFKNGKCLKCHDAHASNIAGMITKKQGFLCYSCHGTDPGQEVKSPKSSHTPVVAGECTRCHNPHKARLDNLLLAIYPDLCLTCHEDLKGAVAGAQAVKPAAGAPAGGGQSPQPAKVDAVKIYVHAPADIKNCQICHRPHFSAEPALMVRPLQVLCGKCHDYNNSAFKAAHIQIDPNEMDCNTCHAPHLSKDPKFFKARVHKPFADRACKDCHIVEQ